MGSRAASAYGATARDIDVDACSTCNLFWFDSGEIVALTPDAVLALFRLVGEAGAPGHALAAAMACPRCRRSLGFTHDVTGTTRFTYWRCAQGHGQLITFSQFLAAKHMIRPPSPAELVKLKATLRQINCSQCGAPIDLQSSSACSHCGSAVMLIDPQGVIDALQDLQNGPHSTASESAKTRAAMTDAQVDALFDLERMRKGPAEENRRDLLAIGASAIGAVLATLFAGR